MADDSLPLPPLQDALTLVPRDLTANAKAGTVNGIPRSQFLAEYRPDGGPWGADYSRGADREDPVGSFSIGVPYTPPEGFAQDPELAKKLRQRRKAKAVLGE